MKSRKKNAAKTPNKIGILTFHCAENYGAFLQTFALEKWLQIHMGDTSTVQIVNYRPHYLVDPYRIGFRSRLQRHKTVAGKVKAFLLYLTELPYKLCKRMKYQLAAGALNTTAAYYDDQFSLDKEYRSLVLGSDQIWNIRMTEGVDRAFWGGVAPEGCRVISYAASAAIQDCSEAERNQIAGYLSKLSAVGVRETALAEVLQPLCAQRISVNIDPTLLVNAEVWRAHLKFRRSTGYILVYNVVDDSRTLAEAHRIAKKTGLPILHFGDPSIKPVFKDVRVRSVAYSGPFDFVSYIAGASVVLTNSFHATCFSLIFHRPFFTYLQVQRSERLRSLGAFGGFRERLLEPEQLLTDDQIATALEMPTEDYYTNLAHLRIQSEAYLIENLKGNCHAQQ